MLWFSKKLVSSSYFGIRENLEWINKKKKKKKERKKRRDLSSKLATCTLNLCFWRETKVHVQG